jgi:hypothetical protein
VARIVARIVRDRRPAAQQCEPAEAEFRVQAAGPALVGAVFDATGDWTWPIVVLLAMTAAQLPAARYAVKGRPT